MMTGESRIQVRHSLWKSVSTPESDAEVLRLRYELVDAAVRLFIEKGYHETTTRDIAEAAGWTVCTLYDFVKSKSDILSLICWAIHEEVAALLSEGARVGETQRDFLRRAVGTYFQYCDSRQDAIVLFYQETTCLSPEARALVMENEERVTANFESYIREGIAEGLFRKTSEKGIQLLAHNITIQGQMWAFRRWYLRKHFTLEEYIALQTDMLLRDLKPE